MEAGQKLHALTRGPAHDAKVESLKTIFDQFEDELSPFIAGVIKEHADNPDTAPEIAAILKQISDPEHFTALTLVIGAVSALVYPIVSAAVQPYTVPIGTDTWLKVFGVESEHIKGYPLTAAELGLAELRHNLPDGFDIGGEAKRNGIDGERYNVIRDNIGEPIALQEALLLYRRGQMQWDRDKDGNPGILQVIRQSRIRDEYANAVQALRYAPPSAAEVIAGVVEGHLTYDEGCNKAEDAGLNPTEFDWMYQTAGRPPGTQELLELLNRSDAGLLDFPWTQDNVEAAIRESNVKDKYIPPILASRYYIPPVRSIPALIRAGAFTDAQAKQALKAHGVRDSDLNAYIAEGHTNKTTVEKQATVSTIMRAYDYNLISRQDAETRLSNLNYNQDSINLILDLADNETHWRMVQSSINKVHMRYVTRKIDLNTALQILQADNIPRAAIDDYLKIWSNEQEALAPSWTLAELNGLLHRGVITDSDWSTRVKNLGYTDDELYWLACLAFTPSTMPSDLRKRFPLGPGK